MANLIDTYLHRVEQRLVKRMPRPNAEECVREIGSHLIEDVQNQIESGMSLEDAEIRAIQNLGSDRLIADSLIRSHSKIDKLSVWRTSWVSMTILLLYGIIPVTFMQFSPVPEWLLSFVGLLPTCFLASFCYGIWRSRRIVVKPVITCVAIVFASVIFEAVLFSPSGVTPMSARARNVMVSNFESSIASMDAKLVAAKDIQQDQLFPIVFRDKNAYLAPTTDLGTVQSEIAGIPFTRSTGYQWSTHLDSFETEKEARMHWKKFGQAYIDSTTIELNEQRNNQEQVRSQRLDSTTAVGIAKRTGLGALTVVAFVLALNFAVLGLSHLIRVIVRLKWRPAKLAST